MRLSNLKEIENVFEAPTDGQCAFFSDDFLKDSPRTQRYEIQIYSERYGAWLDAARIGELVNKGELALKQPKGKHYVLALGTLDTSEPNNSSKPKDGQCRYVSIKGKAKQTRSRQYEIMVYSSNGNSWFDNICINNMVQQGELIVNTVTPLPKAGEDYVLDLGVLN